MPIPTKLIPAAFVRSYRGNPAAEQEERLRALGIKRIYSAAKGESADDALKALRRAGEMLGVAGGLRVLGDTRKEIRTAVDKFHAKAFPIFDIDTERRSDLHGIPMFDEAWGSVNAESRVPDLKKAAEFGALGGIAKGHNAKKGRMPKTKALKIWRDKTTYRTIAEALEHMPKWTKETAIRHLGNRGDKPGRRKR